MVNPVLPPRDALLRMAGGDTRILAALENLFRVAGFETPTEIDGILEVLEQNTSDIAVNSANITFNEAGIANNAVDIDANTADIALNRTDIDINAAAIAVLEAALGDFDIKLVEAEILGIYGDIVSVLGKAKSLQKFGASDTIGTTIGTVWQIPEADETYVAGNVIDTFSSSSASEASTFTIEGHTVTGAGASAVFAFVSQVVTANGQSKVTLGTPLARASRITANGSSVNVGDVYVYEDSATTAGVPDDTATAHILALAGTGQSAKAATTLSGSDYMAITSVYGSVVEKGTAAVDFSLEVRTAGGAFQIKRFFSASNDSGLVVSPIKPYLIVPKNADVRIRAVSSAASTSVSAGFDGYLAGVVV